MLEQDVLAMCDHVRTDAFLKEEKGVIYDIGLLPPCVAPLSSDRKKKHAETEQSTTLLKIISEMVS